MCIGLVFTFEKDGKKYTVVLDQRDGDIAARDLPFTSHNALLSKYEKERAAKGLPISFVGDDRYGLFSASPYINGQMAIGNGHLALLADYRIHQNDPRRKSGVKWWQERGTAVEMYARTGTFTTDYKANEHPHMMLMVDKNGTCESYEFDEFVRNKRMMGNMAVLQTCGSETPNFRRSRLVALTMKTIAEWDGYNVPQCVGDLLCNVLGDTVKPSEGDALLDLGKDAKYERHVESVRIEPVVSWIDSSKPLGWMTVASVACIIDHSRSEIFVVSRSYRKPQTVNDVARCATEFSPVALYNFPWG